MAPAISAKVPTTVHDFVVLPLRLPVQPSFPNEATHYLYLRAHTPKVPTATSPRELFLVNVPIDATDLLLRNLFANQLGGARTEAVAFEGARIGASLHAPVAPTLTPGTKRKRGSDDAAPEPTQDSSTALPSITDRTLHRSGSTAVVTFVDEPSVALALKAARRAAKSARALAWGSSSSSSSSSRSNAKQDADGATATGQTPAPPLGAARYLARHRLRFPERGALQRGVDAYMAAFAAREAARDAARARLRSEPDADGFVTVTRGGRKGPAREEAARAKEAQLRQRERDRVRADFYRFQVREKKKEQAQDLVRGFEEDQRRVAEMKRRRGKIRPE